MSEYCYRGTDGDTQPVKCIILSKFGYPNYCINEEGYEEQMFENTHFLKEADAWFSIVQSINAGIEIEKRSIETIKEAIKDKQKILEALNENLENVKKEWIAAKNNKSNIHADKLRPF